MGKSVSQKLLVKPDMALWISDDEKLELIGPLPEGARSAGNLAEADVAVIFVESESALREALEAHGDRLDQPSVLWFAYPKGNRADINRDSLWPIVASRGLRPITQVAIDEVWSALRFRQLREGEKQFAGQGP